MDERFLLEFLLIFHIAQANQKWDREAEVEARRDSDKSLALYLSAPLIKNKLERVKKDTKLFGYWHRHVQDMPKQN